METTFGKTVETRLLNKQTANYSPYLGNNTHNSKLNAHYFNSNYASTNNNDYFQIRQNSIRARNMLASSSYTTTTTKPSSSIMLRKNYKYLFGKTDENALNDEQTTSHNVIRKNNPNFMHKVKSTAGYSSDSECSSRMANLQQQQQQHKRVNQIFYKEPRFCDPSQTDNNENNFSFNYIGRNLVRNHYYYTDNEEDDVKSCINMRTRHGLSEDARHNFNRFRSIERQTVKNGRSNFNNARGFSQNASATPSTSNSNRLIQQLLERSNNINNNNKFEASNSTRLNHLLSPKITTKVNGNSNSLYNNNSANDSAHSVNATNNVNLTNYLTWKNFNCNPAVNYSATNEPKNDRCENETPRRLPNTRSISTPGTPLLSSTIPRRPKYNQQLKIETSNVNEGIKLSHRSNRMFEKFDSQDVLQKRLDHEPVDSAVFRPSNQAREYSAPCASNCARSRSIPNRSDRDDDSRICFMEKPSNEVISLENALLNMNEILKNLTMIAQKKENDFNEFMCSNKLTSTKDENLAEVLEMDCNLKDLSPPLSTSTSLSFSTGVSTGESSSSSSSTASSAATSNSSSTSTSNSTGNKQTNPTHYSSKQPSTNVSPASKASTSPSYSNTSIQSNKLINKSSTSFSPSESSSSSSSSSSSPPSAASSLSTSSMSNFLSNSTKFALYSGNDSTILTKKQYPSLKMNMNSNASKYSCQNYEQTHGTNQTNNHEKTESVSFSKKLKRFLSLSSSKNTKRN